MNLVYALNLGFKANIIGFSFTILDQDECSDGTHECDHKCTNDIGTYFCSCNDGFNLLLDGRTCVGKCKNVKDSDVPCPSGNYMESKELKCSARCVD